MSDHLSYDILVFSHPRYLVVVRGLASGAVFAPLHRSFAAVARIESDVAVFSGPGQIADAFVGVDQIEAFAVGAGIRLAVVDVHVAIGTGISVETDAAIRSFVIATISAVLTRIGEAPIDATLASKAGETKWAIAGESGKK